MHTKKIKTLQVVPRGGGGADRNTPYGKKISRIEISENFRGNFILQCNAKKVFCMCTAYTPILNERLR